MRLPGALPLSLSFAGLDGAALGSHRAELHRQSGRRIEAADGASIVRELIEIVPTFGLRAVQIDAASPGVRPRDLDRSARRDLAALMRRNELACSGLDLFIPPDHFLDAKHADRAVAGVLGAIDLAADLAGLASGSVASRPQPGSVNVSVRLPGTLPDDIVRAIAGACESRAVRLADHAWPPAASPPASGAIGVGIDPATVIAAEGGDGGVGRGGDPSQQAASLGERLACARLTDVMRASPSVRAIPGDRAGTLDLMAYRVSLQAAGYGGHVVLDLRGLGDHAGAIRSASKAWADADPLRRISAV